MSFKGDDDVVIDVFVKKVMLSLKLATKHNTQIQNKKNKSSNKTQHEAPEFEFKGGDASFCNIGKNTTKQNKKESQQMKYNAKATKHVQKR
jgi:hypothetical protein